MQRVPEPRRYIERFLGIVKMKSGRVGAIPYRHVKFTRCGHYGLFLAIMRMAGVAAFCVDIVDEEYTADGERQRF